MRIFLDTANADRIREAVKTGVLSGVTTNPSLVSQEGKALERCVADILAIDPNLTVLVEVVAEDTGGMVGQAKSFSGLGKDIVVKIPMTREGLAAVRELSRASISTAVTLVFSLNQAVLAACAGADYVAAFVGRLDDIGSDGVGLIRSIRNAFEVQGTETEIIAASLRTPQSVGELYAAGADIVTMPAGIFDAMFRHPLTEAGLKKFMDDWQKLQD